MVATAVASSAMQDLHWHLMTDDELAALLREQGCARVDELVQGRDTIEGDKAVEKALSPPRRQYTPGPSYTPGERN